MPHWDVEIQEDMDKLLNAQLGRLKTDHIDYYLIHGINDKSWHNIEAKGLTDFIKNAKTDGRVINVGFSFHGDNEAFTTIVDAYDWDFCQIQYNFLDEQNQAGKKGLKYAASKELGVIIMEPLRGGLLGKVPPPGVSEIWDEAEEKRTPSEWALRWVWNHPEVTVVLSGMNEEDHIKENIKTANAGYPNSLSEADLALIQKVEDKYRSLMKAGCTGCHYCMPCPNGVNIPACFEAYNFSHMYGYVKWAKFFYLARVGGLGGIPGRASQCEECGDCIEACPQGLPIPDLLKEITSEMEGRFYDAKLWFFGNILKFQRKKFLKDGAKPI
jgi:predicted aldo/keto reductase-like oxidoreductase